MANPRKFSEKIALHHQKQAEETAAFEQIMREVSDFRPPPYQKINHLQLTAQSLGAYRGGSLPNVNLGNNAIDLRGALHTLEGLKAPPTGRDSYLNLHPRRGASQHRRHNIDASPYGTFLSPPDTNWRRTNSDSALHQSAMAPPDYHNTHPSIHHPSHRRKMVDGPLGMGDRGHISSKSFWDKKVAQSRPKSCEVPPINIYPSSERDSGIQIPISNNTGSLPDLTNLHIPSPLATPIDVEDQQQQQQQAAAPSTAKQPSQPQNNSSPTGGAAVPFSQPNASLPPSTSHRLTLQTRPQQQQQQQQHQIDQQQQQQQGPPPPLEQPQQSPQSAQPGHTTSPGQQRRRPGSGQAAGAASSSFIIGQGSPRRVVHQQPLSPPSIAVDGRPMEQSLPPQYQAPLYPSPQTQMQAQQPQHSMSLDMTTQSLLQQYVTAVDSAQLQQTLISTSCGSPTSPLSNPNCSPLTSPTSVNNVLPPLTLGNNHPHSHPQQQPQPQQAQFTSDPYYIQQQQQTSLQHQFEQFSMMPNNVNTINTMKTMNTMNSMPSTNSQSNPYQQPIMYSGGQMAGVGVGMAGGPVANIQGITTVQDIAAFTQQQQKQQQQQQQLPSKLATYQQVSPQQQQQQQQQHSQQLQSVLISHQQQQQHLQQLQHPNNTTIPDIVFTGVSESPPRGGDFAKDISNAMAGMAGGFDSDFFSGDDALKVGLDPLDLDSINMLSDNDIIADPATEDQFRLDRL